MRSISQIQTRQKAGFTLVELLVATAVLVLLVAMVGQLFNSATTATTGSRKQLDSDNQARMVFDRMALDFGKMVKRKDADSILCKTGTTNKVQNDKFFFFSEAPAYSGTGIQNNKSSMALVGYRINSNNQLERLGTTLAWDGTVGNPEEDYPGGIVFVSGTDFVTGTTGRIAYTWPNTIGKYSDSPSPFASGSSRDYHVLSESVYRMEICFLVKDFNLDDASATKAIYSNYPVAVFHTNSNPSSDPAMKAHTRVDDTVPTSSVVSGDRWFDTKNFRCYVNSNGKWQPNGMDDVLGIVVTIALLDESSRQAVVDPSTRAIRANIADSMIRALPEPADAELNPLSASDQPKLIAQKWQEALYSSDFRQNSGLPQSVASQVRIYQRYFSLKNK